jgi:uncharacterized protein
MRIEDRFRVSVPVEEAWRVLLDLERIAPCMPGAELQEVEGDEYRGIVKVKVGPITAQYKGAARLDEVDDASHRAVIKAQGRDTRGQGNASATITISLAPDGDATDVSVDNDVTITGKVAQFGRGVMADVSSKLLAQFVECLERDVLSGGSTPDVSAGTADAGPVTGQSPEFAEAGAGEDAPAGPRRIESPEARPVDLLRTAGAPVAKRLVPGLIVLVVVIVVLVLLVR